MSKTQSTEGRLLKLAAEIKASHSPAEIAKLVRLIEPAPSTGEMSAEGFEQLLAELKAKSGGRAYSDKSIEAARLVFVMGASPTEAAASAGLTKQAGAQLITRIRRRMEAVPPGWEQVSRWFPADTAKQVNAYADALKAAHAAGEPLDEAPDFGEP